MHIFSVFLTISLCLSLCHSLHLSLSLHFCFALYICVSLLVSPCVSAGDLTASVYTVTSKSAVLSWSKYSGSSSYRLTASPRNSPDPSVFTSFSQFTLIGSIISLSPNTAYTFKVEALDSSMRVLAQTSVNGYTGVYHTHIYMFCLLTAILSLTAVVKIVTNVSSLSVDHDYRNMPVL